LNTAQFKPEIRREIDFEAHNAEAQAVWEAFHAGQPTRVPVQYSMNARMLLLDPALNPRGYTFKDYFENPEITLAVQVAFQYWKSHNVLDDATLGLPKEWWVYADFQNCEEEMWFGAPVIFPSPDAADCQPTCERILAEDKKRLLFDRGLPEPMSGPIARAGEIQDFFNQRRQEGFEYAGRPINTGGLPGLGTDGPFTVAAALRGATELCLDLYEDPEYAHELLGYITEATIHRIKKLRKFLGQDPKPESWGFADDSIALLSADTYREFVRPCHKRLLAELAGAGPHSIHLCGDATRHFPRLMQELNIKSFDTGFPVDFAWLRKTLGPEVTFRGGPPVAVFLHGTPPQVAEATRRILISGIMQGGKFILGEGNNMSPRTPLANMDACYLAAKEAGRYS